MVDLAQGTADDEAPTGEDQQALAEVRACLARTPPRLREGARAALREVGAGGGAILLQPSGHKWHARAIGQVR